MDSPPKRRKHSYSQYRRHPSDASQSHFVVQLFPYQGDVPTNVGINKQNSSNSRRGQTTGGSETSGDSSSSKEIVLRGSRDNTESNDMLQCNADALTPKWGKALRCPSRMVSLMAELITTDARQLSDETGSTVTELTQAVRPSLVLSSCGYAVMVRSHAPSLAMAPIGGCLSCAGGGSRASLGVRRGQWSTKTTGLSS